MALVAATRALPRALSAAPSAALRRAYATAVPMDEPFPGVPQPEGAATSSPTQITKLSNGVVVASNDNGSPASSVSVVVAAGSRYETAGNQGAAQLLAHSAFQSTTTRTPVRVTREMDFVGAQLSAAASREFVSYSAAFLRGDASIVLDTLFDSVAGQQLEHWEVAEAMAKLNEEGATVEDLILDDIHAAAFRNGLGNELYSPFVSSLSVEDLRAYAASTIVGPRTAVVGTGIDHETLVKLASSTLGALPSANKAAAAPSKYFGGAEIRRNMAGLSKTHVALAFEGAPIVHADMAALQVLRQIIGGDKAVKWGVGASKIGSRIGSVAGARAFCFSESYTDSGIFGVYAIAAQEDAAQVVSAAADGIKEALGGKISDEEVARAKKAVIQEIVEADRETVLEAMGTEVFASRQCSDTAASVAKVEGVTVQSVKAAAQRLKASKPILAAQGNLFNLPHLDDLF